MSPTLTTSDTATDAFARRTLSDLVAEVPARARVFERFHLDYCCHGDRPLDEACRRRDLAVDQVVADMLDAPEGDGEDRAHEDRDWREAGVSELIDHIVDAHHGYLRRELPRLDGLSRKVADHHGHRDSRLVEARSVFALLRGELEGHMTKEEQILFPLGRRLEAGDAAPHHCGSVRNPVAAMVAEHEDAGSGLEKLRELTDGFRVPDDACATYTDFLESLEALEADLHIHIHEENNVLFPRLVELEEQKAATA